MTKALKITAFPFVIVFQFACAILAGVFTFLWELVKLPFTPASSCRPLVDDHDYEYQIDEYLRRREYNGVSVTQAPGNYGADVTAKKEGAKKYAVQHKYYSLPIGVTTVQEVTAAKTQYGCNAAMMVANNTFTAAAEKLVAGNSIVLLLGVTGMRIKKIKSTKQKSAAPVRAAQKVEAAAPAQAVNATALRSYLPLDLGAEGANG